MKLKTNYYTTSKTARYASYGELGEQTKYFWFVLHGSKMLCEQMLYKFKDFDPVEHFVVAPEALSRFYEKEFMGPVVASWMTKRDRLSEIDDNNHYLSGLYTHFTTLVPESCKKIVLAFSQGGTIAFRWFHAHTIEVDFLIPYACWIPEDIDLSTSQTDLQTQQILFTYGEQDQFLTAERIKMIEQVIHSNQLRLTQLPYQGDHRISRPQLHSIFQDYIKE